METTSRSELPHPYDVEHRAMDVLANKAQHWPEVVEAAQRVLKRNRDYRLSLVEEAARGGMDAWEHFIHEDR